MSQVYNPGVITSISAAADLVEKRFIGVDGNLCGAGARCAGVSINATKSGQACAIVTSGIAVVEAGGVVTAGDMVKSDASGKAVAAAASATDSSVPKEHNGTALEAASGDGVFIRVRLV